MHVFNRIRMLRFVLPAFAIAALAACNDDSAGPEEEHPEAAFVEVVLGTQAVRVNEGDQVTGGPLLLQVGANNITIRFLDEDGEVLGDIAGDADVDVEVEAGNDRVTYTAATRLTGVITGVTAGESTIEVTLWHDDHREFGPRTVPITVQ